MKVVEFESSLSFDEWCYVAGALANGKTESYREKNENGETVVRRFYADLVCTFDTETTSAAVKGSETITGKEYAKLTADEQAEWTKTAWVYAWMFGFGSRCYVGRDLKSFRKFMRELRKVQRAGLVVYVHNLSFDFEFMQNVLRFVKVFARDKHQPMKARDEFCNEWRDSLVLSGYSLEQVGKQLDEKKHPGIKKKVGDLDYDKIRTPETELTPEEWGYCVGDIEVLSAYISDELETYGSFKRIPLTSTGKVRQDVRNKTLRNKKTGNAYKALVQGLQIEGPEEYEQLKRAFQGGFTHAGNLWVNETLESVRSMDFTSSYPAQMVMQLFPMSSAVKVYGLTVEQMQKDAGGLYVFDFTVEGLRDVFGYDHFWSVSKTTEITGQALDNGRVISCESMSGTMTSIDFRTFSAVYEWDKFVVYNVRRYAAARLPREFVDAILSYYEAKTKLKGLPEFLAEYQHGKGMLNGLFGMSVTDIVADEITYENGAWGTVEADAAEQLEKYNKNKNRFLFYVWGVFVTAYARWAVWTGIRACGRDYHYCDTDSIKFSHAEKYENYFTSYNKMVAEKMEAAMRAYGFPLDRWKPKNKEGEEKPLGFWDFDGDYARFKTLGAKRYIVKYADTPENGKSAGKFAITVAGVTKKAAAWLQQQDNNGGFDAFSLTDDKTVALEFPQEVTGKMIHTYLAGVPRVLTVTDYTGKTAKVFSGFGVCLTPTGYNLGTVEEYFRYIQDRKEYR